MTDTKPKIFIDNMADYYAELLVQHLIQEPVLTDPRNEFYKNEEERDKALQRLADVVNEDSSPDDPVYTTADVEENIKYVRNMFRRCRLARCEYYMRKRKLPVAEKWYEWMYSKMNDENKFVYKHYIPGIKDKAEAKKKRAAARNKVKELILGFIDMESKLMSGEASPCESDESSDEEPTPAKKPKRTDELLKFTFNLD